MTESEEQLLNISNLVKFFKWAEIFHPSFFEFYEEGAEGEPADIEENETPEELTEGILSSLDEDDDDYDMSDYYEEYEGRWERNFKRQGVKNWNSGNWFDTFKGVGSKFMNIFGNDDVDDFEYEGSAIVEDWLVSFKFTKESKN